MALTEFVVKQEKYPLVAQREITHPPTFYKLGGGNVFIKLLIKVTKIKLF